VLPHRLISKTTKKILFGCRNPTPRHFDKTRFSTSVTSITRLTFAGIVGNRTIEPLARVVSIVWAVNVRNRFQHIPFVSVRPVSEAMPIVDDFDGGKAP
jgi:hypothetical protein